MEGKKFMGVVAELRPDDLSPYVNLIGTNWVLDNRYLLSIF